MITRKLVLALFALASLSFSGLALADHGGHSGPGGHCKAGDVYCGGECHSSWDKCPGNGDHHHNNPPYHPHPQPYPYNPYPQPYPYNPYPQPYPYNPYPPGSPCYYNPYGPFCY